MFDYRQNADLCAVNRFLQDNWEVIGAASFILGGQRAFNRSKKLLEDVCAGTVLTRQLKRELQTLHDLLSLRHVTDPENRKCGYLAESDLADPVVEGIFLLKYGLHGILTQIDAEQELPPKDHHLAA
ncbi:hypothetical protein [Falsihalocynthiibacter arcticus]|uniref:Uncharacterized protein n=1 Tax=Falsihalocynthiibacter arcticus TaxID=1579316 RepID=A0A126V4K8_9RHOB|nr:hypothetical protein [Falsihalocynthiibacter arcticus]AML52806.1 hypothetical protein RC74_17465 [Falsihalocynthiibacter arcticus]